MPGLELVVYGHPALRRRAEEVKRVDSGLVYLVETMKEVLDEYEGLGLAAPQVGQSLRVITVRPSLEAEAVVLLNPVMTAMKGKERGLEGCLSIPGIRAMVRRAVTVRVEGVDLHGKKVSFDASGLAARVFQHEIDHLNGILFVDRISKEAYRKISASLRSIERGEVSPRYEGELLIVRD